MLQIESDPSKGPAARRLKLLDHFQIDALLKEHDLDSYSVSLTDEGSEDSVSDAFLEETPSKEGEKTKGKKKEEPVYIVDKSLKRQKVTLFKKTEFDSDAENIEEEEDIVDEEDAVNKALAEAKDEDKLNKLN